MIRDICRDESFLAQKAEPAAADDLGTAQDLLDTLSAHRDGCVGMAANMIGVNKRIIVFDNEEEYMVMLNPGHRQKVRRIRGDGGLPFSCRHAENDAFPNHQGAVAE